VQGVVQYCTVVVRDDTVSINRRILRAMATTSLPVFFLEEALVRFLKKYNINVDIYIYIYMITHFYEHMFILPL
jgi:hypothetical protein